jgi:branched-subunit amino acid aminotransferase/4-amino-4-deoxychorismate lyase
LFVIKRQKNVVEAIQGNLFMLTGNKLITPPVSEGCLNGVMRKQVLNSQKNGPFEVVEEAISPLIYKSRRIIYHKRYQGNTAHNIQKKRI